jgi:hypothetical protein
VRKCILVGNLLRPAVLLYEDGKEMLCMIVLSDRAGGLFFGWNALSLMIKDLGNFDEGCQTRDAYDIAGKFPTFQLHAHHRSRRVCLMIVIELVESHLQVPQRQRPTLQGVLTRYANRKNLNLRCCGQWEYLH